MKKIYLLIVFLQLCLLSYSQDTFQKTYGGNLDEFAYSVRQLADSGFILTGNTGSFGTGGDVYILRTDKYGETLWTKTYGGAANDYSYFVEQTSDNGFIITGATQTLGFGWLDVLLIKTDSIGNVLWSHQYGGADFESGYVVHETPFGEFIIAGFTESYGAGASDVYLLKTSATGNLLWAKTFGDTILDAAYALEIASDGGYIIAGSTNSLGAGDYDALLIKTDTAGNILWSKTYGSSGADEAYTILQTPDNGFMVGGITFFGAGNYDDYLFKTDSFGNLSWSKAYGGTANREYVNYIRPSSSGNYVFAGTTGSFGTGGDNVHLLQVDGAGNLAWSRDFGGTLYDEGFGMETTFDNGIVICGRTESFGSGSYDVYLIKTDSAGNSGCHNSSNAAITTSPATLVSTVVLSVSTGGIDTISTPAISFGATVTTLCQVITGSGELQEEKFQNGVSVYPNPFSSEAIISVYDERYEMYDFKLYDITGKEIIKFAITNPKSEIQRGKLHSGIYFYKVTGEVQQGVAEIIGTGKIIIE